MSMLCNVCNFPLRIFSDMIFMFFWFQGRFTIAAKHHISIAEIYETELVDVDKVRRNICALMF